MPGFIVQARSVHNRGVRIADEQEEVETHLASGTLADEAGAVLGKAVVVETETFDVGMRRHA
jgi:adenylosuccinate synthase